MRVLVFIHGFMEDATMWQALKQLEKDFYCVYLDYPGHGKKRSEASEKCLSIQTIAQNLSNEINQLGIESYDCVGHSMGGYVGLALAQLDKKLNKLLLFHSNHWADDEEKQRNRKRVAQVVTKSLPVFLREAIPNLFLDPKKHQKEVETLILNAKKLNPEVVANCSIAMKDRKDFSSWVSENHQHCFFIQGESDNVIPLSVSEKKWCGKKEHFFILKKCGHMSHIEQTELTIKLMKKIFLSSTVKTTNDKRH